MSERSGSRSLGNCNRVVERRGRIDAAGKATRCFAAVVLIWSLVASGSVFADEMDECFHLQAHGGSVTVGMKITGKLTFQPSLEYSTEPGYWYSFQAGTTTVTLNDGETAYFRAKGSWSYRPNNAGAYCSFSMSGEGSATMTAHGNVASLISSSNYSSSECLALDCAFSHLFEGCEILTRAPDLPDITYRGSRQLYGMFKGCTSLTNAPGFRMKGLTYACCDSMFWGCTALLEPPKLPFTQMTNGCYWQMFYGCTSLKTAPELPATVLSDRCYGSMFALCTSLAVAPKIHAEKLGNQCCFHMFAGCTSLRKVEVDFPEQDNSVFLTNWLKGVSGKGILRVPEGYSSEHLGNAIPEGWVCSAGNEFCEVFVPGAAGIKSEVSLGPDDHGEPCLLGGVEDSYFNVVPSGTRLTISFARDDAYNPEVEYRLNGRTNWNLVVESDVDFQFDPTFAVPRLSERVGFAFIDMDPGVVAVEFKETFEERYRIAALREEMELWSGSELDLKVYTAKGRRYVGPTKCVVREEGVPVFEVATVDADGEPPMGWRMGWDRCEYVAALRDGEDGLRFVGTGETDGFDVPEACPWMFLKDAVTRLEVADGVILGRNCLKGFSNVKTVNGKPIEDAPKEIQQALGYRPHKGLILLLR